MILGHERQWEYLKKVHEQKSFAHAYLFFGPQHVGKRTIAKEWAKLFFSVEAKEGIDAGTNPDVIFFSIRMGNSFFFLNISALIIVIVLSTVL